MPKNILDQKPLQLVKQAILEEAERLGVRVEKIILFGSRARGDHREESDWDILVIVSDNTSSQKTKQLRRNLYMKLDIPIDIITLKKTLWEKYRHIPGTIAYEAAKEGQIVA